MSERDEFESWLRNKIKFTLFTLGTAALSYLLYLLFKKLFRRG